MLQVRELTYYYPDTDHPALRALSLDLSAGEILLLAGGSGSGKSTLCAALAGFAPHFYDGEIEGDVLLDGRSMRATPLGEWVQQVGLVLQNPFNQITGARITVFEEVAFGLENLGVPREAMGERVRAVLEQLDILHLADRSPYALSGGQMQRVAIASILALSPRLLILDEPTAQLDPAGTSEVFEVLRGLAAQGATIVLASHKLGEAADLATRAAVLEAGTLVCQGEARAVLGDPRLPGWRVEPPIFVPLAARLALPTPFPVTLEEAVEAFSAVSPSSGGGAAGWPFAPPLPPAGCPPLSPAPLSVEGLHFAYPSGVEALRGLSLHAEPGRLTALIGENGAGKSTLARTLNGLLRPTAGSITIGDWNVAEHPTSELARRVAYLFQNPDDQLFKPTVEQEVAFGPQNLGFTPSEVEEAVELALALTDLASLREAHPYDLHPVQRRWVALAAVLAQRAPLLVLDEPTTGLDLAGKEQMAGLLAALKGAGYTLLLISHDMQFVAAHADWLYVMAGGQVLAAGPPATLFAEEATLGEAGVEPPPLARLARRLGLDERVITPTRFVEALGRCGRPGEEGRPTG